MKYAAALLISACALAQQLPDIRGVVTEYGGSAPIAAAQITLIEFVSPEGLVVRKQVATALSDAQGAFAFKLEHRGQYFVEASKPGYLTGDEFEGLGIGTLRSIMEVPVAVPEEDSSNIRFSLIRPGGLTGRVIDENDKPVPNFTVIAISNTFPNRQDRAVTDKDGIFTFPAIIPSPRIIRAGPNNPMLTPALTSFTKEDVEKVTEDIETSYWPGGVRDPALALPLPMIPGAVVSAGTVRLRKVPYYRARLIFSGECGEREGWMLTVDSSTVPARCSKELLLERLLPGRHTLTVELAGSRPGISRWALELFTIGDENVDVPVTFHPATDIPVRVIGPDPNVLSTSRIALRATEFSNPMHSDLRIVPMAPTLPGVAWSRHQVSFQLLDPNVAIKEIRYANQPAPDGVITLTPGAALEFVIDGQPSSLSGTAPAQSMVYLAKWPFVPNADRPFTFISRADSSGNFNFPALSAGDYRVITSNATNLDAKALEALLQTASRITLEKGIGKTIELR